MDKTLIKDELFKVLNTFINEIDLTIDYISKDTIQKINSYIQKINKNQGSLDIFVHFIKDYLKTFETQFATCLFSNKKIKTSYYTFLNDIKLFGESFNLLDFMIFQNESKNTKKDITGYLYSIYMACVFLCGNFTQDQMSTELSNFVNKIKIAADNTEQQNLEETINKLQELQEIQEIPEIPELQELPEFDQLKQLQNSHLLDRRNAIDSQTPLLLNQTNEIQNMMNSLLPSLNQGPDDGLSSIMNDILGNSDIMNVAKEMAEQMQNSNVDPMTMMSSLMSGNTEGPLQNIMNKIKSTVDTKIDSGELNVNTIQNQAQDIMKNLGTNLQSTNMQDILKQFTNKQDNTNKEEMEEFIKKMMNDANLNK
jgi:hypothetical protein